MIYLFKQIRGLGHTLPQVMMSLKSINTMSRPPAWQIVMGLWDSRLIKDSFKFIFLYST